MIETLMRKTPRILFVDDEENVLRALKRLFVDEDYEVLTALSGPEGLKLIEQNPAFAVIISDQRMPGMSGWEFLEKACTLVPDAVRIVLTGYADVEAAINAINKGGAYRYLTKPWNDDELRLMVRDAVDKFGLIAENRYLTALTAQQNEELSKWNTQLEAMVQEQTLDIQNKNKELQRLNDQLSRNFRSSIEAFTSLIEMREKSVSSHSKNVAAYARQIALGMSLPGDEVSNILVAALLHDIGKIGVPDSVLLKDEEQFNEHERKEYNMHAVRGQAAVEGIEGFQEIGQLIRHHHEHIDGSGYPDSLKKNAIPVGSRIIAIADAMDRIASRDPLSPASYAAALKHLEFYSDTYFDHGILPVAGAILKKKIEALTRPSGGEEIEIPSSRLAPGMVLSRDVRSGTGLLILARDVVLDLKVIAGLQRYYQIDPPATGVFVRKTGLGRPVSG